MTAPVDGAAALRTLRALCLALVSAPFVITIAMFFVLHGKAHRGTTPAWMWFVLLGLAAAVTVAIPAVGYPAATPLEPSTDAPADATRTRELFQSALILRFALADSVLIVGIALASSDPAANFLICLLGAAIALALLGVHAWPSPRLLQRAQERPNRNGASYDVLGAYGLR